MLRWLKAVGEPVAKHEPLVEIETDKVTIEVSAPADGVLGEIAAAEGTDVAPGALLGPMPGHRNRVIRKDGCAIHIPLLQPHAAPVLEVYGRNDQHGNAFTLVAGARRMQG